MKRLLITAALVVVAAVALAACGGSGGDNSSASAGGGTATVSSEDIGGAGDVLVDSSGQALYAADQEANGDVVCTDACTSIWMPLTLTSGAPTGNDVSGRLGTVARPDGTRQVTLDGRLLYTFAQDKPGEVTGEGVSDAFGGRQFTWHVVHADGSTGSDQGSTNAPGYGY